MDPLNLPSIKLQMLGVELHRQGVEVTGGYVQAILRPFDEAGPAQWVFNTTEGVDVNDPQVLKVLSSGLKEAFDRFGRPPNFPSDR